MIYVIEYAISGRAKCAWCGDVIEKDSLRIGKRFPSGFGDYSANLTTKWYHANHFFDHFSVRTSDLEGYDLLTRADQKWVLVQLRKTLPHAGI